MGLDGIYESIEITTPDYGDFLIMEDVVEMNQRLKKLKLLILFVFLVLIK